MKVNKWLLILLIVLGGATVYVITTRKKSTLRQELREFAVKDTSAISKIFLANRNGNTITLERQNQGKWMLNHKDEPKYDLLNILLDAICKVEVRSPVAKAAYNNVVKSLAASAIKCEIYLNGDSVPFKTYYVGGQTEDALGTFMMLENSSMPFITQIPGFNGYLTPRYSVSEDAWKSTVLFGYQPGEIKSVLINYKNAPDRSFLIMNEKGRFLVLNPNTNQFIQETDSTAIDNYLVQFRNIFYESVVKSKQRDTLSLTEPSIRISVKGSDNKLKEVEIYPYPLSKQSLAQTDSLGKVLQYDLDRVYGIISPENTLVTIQQPMLNRMLRQLTDFDAGKVTNRRKK